MVQDAILDGLYPNPFMITYNSDTLVSLSGAIHASQNIYNNSFVGQIGDVIGFQGPALFAQLTIPGASFNGGESWEAFVTADFNASVAVTAVPEPETWAMLLAGLGLVGMAARRRTS